MKALKERILKDGKCFPGGILKVDKFINHQMDPNLMKDIAVELIRRFASSEVNKIITIEASGIAPAIMMGFLLNLPVVFAKKKKPSTMGDMLSTQVTSFTKQRTYDVVISKEYLDKNDKVLFVDDFLAYGNAAKGIIDLVKQAGAELVGMGFIIEKAFQNGGLTTNHATTTNNHLQIKKRQFALQHVKQAAASDCMTLYALPQLHSLGFTGYIWWREYK